MKTALYSTFYPAMLPYLAAFVASLEAQSDQTFDLWIGLDELKQSDLVNIPYLAKAHFVCSQNDTPTSLREKSLTTICEHYDAVILIDSDDILLANRVSRAKAALQDFDVYACALELINEQGKKLKTSFNLESAQQDWQALLSSVNVFGFSNTAYRTSILKACFPVPQETVMLDWLVATKALFNGARLYFDTTAHMLYRQYETNTARVLAPYTSEQIHRSSQLLLQHYSYVLESFDTPILNNQQASFLQAIQTRQKKVQRFSQSIEDSATLSSYTAALNQLKIVFLWWECVAHPDLETVWI